MDLNQITIPTLNLTAAVAFYETLGLELIVLAEPRYARFECPNGTSTFSIHTVDELPSGNGIILYFECEDLDTKVTELEEKGIRFEEGPKDQSWLWREALLNDPDGNVIKLYHAGENRKNPPWRISKDS
ncbi:MAG: VOC family protein [Bacteroidota bacterium]